MPNSARTIAGFLAGGYQEEMTELFQREPEGRKFFAVFGKTRLCSVQH